MPITGCPQAQITPDVWEALELSELAAKGAWPVAGGTLDQSQAFVDFARLAWNQESYWRAKLGIE